jgi:hypothetical protein
MRKPNRPPEVGRINVSVLVRDDEDEGRTGQTRYLARRLGRDQTFSVLVLCWVFNPACRLLAFRAKRQPGGRYSPTMTFVDKLLKAAESAAWLSMEPKSYSPSLCENKDE